MGPIAKFRRAWRAFAHDEPGQRFQHQRERLQRRHGVVRVALATVGIVLVGAGLLLLVLPGPGLPLLAIGLGLLAGLSGALARALDRAEPVLRHQAKLLRAGWSKLSRAAKVAACGLGGIGTAAAGLGLYRFLLT